MGNDYEPFIFKLPDVIKSPLEDDPLCKSTDGKYIKYLENLIEGYNKFILLHAKNNNHNSEQFYYLEGKRDALILVLGDLRTMQERKITMDNQE